MLTQNTKKKKNKNKIPKMKNDKKKEKTNTIPKCEIRQRAMQSECIMN